MKKSILMVALEHIGPTDENVATLDIDMVQDVCRNFNMFGYRVLLATTTGTRLLEDPARKLEGILDVNHPVPLGGLEEDDFKNFCGMYVLSLHRVSLETLQNCEPFSRSVNYFMRHNLVIAVDTPHEQKVRLPQPWQQSNIWQHTVADNGYAYMNMPPLEFSRSVMDVVSLQMSLERAG